MKNIQCFLLTLLLPFGSLSAQLTATINDSTNLTCFESMDGTASVAISGGAEPYEILWDDDSLTTEAFASNLFAGRWYRVTVTDASMEAATDSVILSQPDEITYEIGGLKQIQCYGPAEGYIKITSAGGRGPHSYTWNGLPGSDSIYELTAGKQYFGIIDSTGCSLEDSLTLTEADEVDITIDSVFPNPCLGLELGAIYVSGSGGELPYAYSWTGPTGFSSGDEDINGLKEGMYCLDLTDARGCLYERDTAIADGDPITVSYSVSNYKDHNLICHGDSSGSISVDTVEGNGLDWKDYTYIWTGPGGYKAYTYEISNLTAGNYYLNVFDSVNCRSNISVILSQPPVVGIVYDSVVTNPCLDDQNSAIYVSISDGIEPYTYSWTGPDEFTRNSQDIMNLSKGEYTVSVTDSDGCNSRSDTTLSQVDDIELILALSEYGEYNVSCHGSADGFIKIQSIPGYGDLAGFTFLTTGPDGFSSPFRFITSAVKAGMYQITARDPLGCSGKKDTLLTEPPAVETGAIYGEKSFILDTNYVYMVDDTSSSGSFFWHVQGGEIWTGQGTGSVEIEWRTLQSGLIKVIETSGSGCTGDTVYLQTSIKTDVTGFREPERAVSIYPNPTENTLYVKGLEHLDGTLEFYSLLGKLVFRTDLAVQLDLASLDKGVYYVRISNRSGEQIHTEKIIKK